MAPITIAIVGVGQRGSIYAKFALENPERVQVVAAVDPVDVRRKQFAETHGIPEDMSFKDWPELAGKPKVADAIIIATPDRMHKEPVLAFAALGYHILLEKPMSVTESDCIDIVKAVEKHKVMLGVCHVLRYAPQMQKIRELIKDGHVGSVLNIQHIEAVGYWHFAHSFVRGNWGNTARSTFALMAKCCHDVDLLTYWMDEVKPTHVSSFGGLHHFKAANKPEGAAGRCLDCPVAGNCPYDATKIYLDKAKQGAMEWPVAVITEDHTVEGVTRALREGPYGQCVYELDNDVCDNQVVSLRYENGATATLTMAATTEDFCLRTTRVFGTRGEIKCTGTNEVSLYDFLTNKTEVFDCTPQLEGSKMTDHGGSDHYLMDSFVRAVAEGRPELILTTPRATLHSHQLVFAAERARVENSVVPVILDW